MIEGYEKLLGFDLVQMVRWLDRALRGQESLPRLTPDESSHLAIVRLETTLPPRESNLLRIAEMRLVQDFCRQPSLDESYAEELLFLISEFRNPESVERLSRFADDPAALAALSLKVRQIALSRLVYTTPRRSADFWLRRVEDDADNYGAIAFSGLLATDPLSAPKILCRLPNSERMGRAIVLKLDLTWDEPPPEQQSALVDSVARELGRCGDVLAVVIREWLIAEPRSWKPTYNHTIHKGLKKTLNGESAARRTNPALASAYASARADCLAPAHV